MHCNTSPITVSCSPSGPRYPLASHTHTHTHTHAHGWRNGCICAPTGVKAGYECATKRRYSIVICVDPNNVSIIVRLCVQKVLKQIELTGTITAMEHSNCTIMFGMIGGTEVCSLSPFICSCFAWGVLFWFLQMAWQWHRYCAMTFGARNLRIRCCRLSC